MISEGNKGLCNWWGVGMESELIQAHGGRKLALAKQHGSKNGAWPTSPTARVFLKGPLTDLGSNYLSKCPHAKNQHTVPLTVTQILLTSTLLGRWECHPLTLIACSLFFKEKSLISTQRKAGRAYRVHML